LEEEQSVLLVEQDEQTSSRLAGWLEDAGYDVLVCPGPSAPDYRCVASRRGSCPLVAPVDLVVLDLWLAGDAHMIGTSSGQLLDHYIATGKPVIALSHDRHGQHLFTSEDVVTLEWPAERRELVETVRVLLRRDMEPRPRAIARRVPHRTGSPSHRPPA